MRWFPIIGAVFPIAAIQLSVIRAKGRSDLFFWIDLFKNVVAITVLLFTLRHGILAIAIGQVVVSLFSQLFVNAPACQYVFGYRVSEQMHDIFPCVIAVVVAIFGAFVMDSTFQTDSHWLSLITEGVTFFSFYFAVCLFFNIRGTSELRSQLAVSMNKLLGMYNRATPKNGTI